MPSVLQQTELKKKAAVGFQSHREFKNSKMIEQLLA